MLGYKDNKDLGEPGLEPESTDFLEYSLGYNLLVNKMIPQFL
jgi:hypothetical protein